MKLIKNRTVDINLKSDQNYSGSAQIIKTSPNKKLKISVPIVGIEGKPYSAYFCVILFDKNNIGMGRRIRWLNDFSGEEKNYEIIFKTPSNCTSIKFVYRINNETPVKDSCHYIIVPPEKILLQEVNDSIEEKYESPLDYILPRPKELSSEQESILESNIIWLFASARSGTSWLGKMLESLNLKFINEPLIGCHLGFRDPSRINYLRDIEFFKNDPNYFFSERYKLTWQFYLRKLLLNRIYAESQNYDSLIIIKEPNGIVGADIILNCLPNSKMIFLIRDGRDVLDSLWDAAQEKSELRKRFQTKPVSLDDRENFLEQTSEIWKSNMGIIISAFGNHKDELKIKTRYEDLRSNTFEEFKKICNFLKISETDNKIQEIIDKMSFENIPAESKGIGKVTRSAKPEKWRENFSEEEKLKVNKIMNDMLLKLGYKI